MIRMVYMPPGESARIVENDGSLETLQALVGGYICSVGLLQDKYVVYADDDGRLKWNPRETDIEKQGIRPNRWFQGNDILGPMVVVRADEESMTGLEAVLLCQYMNGLPAVKPEELGPPGFAVLTRD